LSQRDFILRTLLIGPMTVGELTAAWESWANEPKHKGTPTRYQIRTTLQRESKFFERVSPEFYFHSPLGPWRLTPAGRILAKSLSPNEENINE
jgi:hypothetical protein